MALFDWLEVVQFTTGGWRCALTIPGEQCVMAFGVVMMLQWSADNLDILRVRAYHDSIAPFSVTPA